MQILSSNDRIEGDLRGGVIALGNFDGFHFGHQAVVGRALERARALGVPLIIATFDPHPVRYFKPEAPPFRLTNLDQRQRLFAEAGADAMLVFHFDRELSEMPAEDFIDRLLIDRFGARMVVTGQDFTFGKGRGGNVGLLAVHAEGKEIEVEAVQAVSDGKDIISSSRIRAALQEGRCEDAARLMTRPFTIAGKVIHGDKNGRKLGFPTANMELGEYLRPQYGIYAVRGCLPDGRVVDGAANIGMRPTFDPPRELLEPYFFDFSGDLYGKEIAVEFHHFIRPEAKFDSLDELMAQMTRDCDRARELLA